MSIAFIRSGMAWTDASLTSEGQFFGLYLLARKLSLLKSLLSAQSRTFFSWGFRPSLTKSNLAG